MEVYFRQFLVLAAEVETLAGQGASAAAQWPVPTAAAVAAVAQAPQRGALVALPVRAIWRL
jgi:hypothetical protein